MSVSRVDREWTHLYPDFRVRLQKTINAVEARTGHTWTLVEGHRSQARQTWLYAQGRTRPGNIVTWKKTPSWHGTGLAADVAPLKDDKVWYHCPIRFWEILLQEGKKQGLSNPAWVKGDRGHLQLTNLLTQAKAKKWVKNGFR